jgi:hypothetical protein
MICEVSLQAGEVDAIHMDGAPAGADALPGPVTLTAGARLTVTVRR